MPDELWTDDEWRAAMSAAEVNDLPDSDFAYIEPGGEKDDEGKTTPRSLRHFPINDEAHVRNALARLGSSPFGDKAKAKVVAAAKKFGIEVSEEDAAGDAPEHRHDALTGSHTHSHPANGSQGADESHSHEHEHSGDSAHGHAHGRSARSGLHVNITGGISPTDAQAVASAVDWKMRHADLAALLPQRATVRGSREERYRSFDGCEIREVPNGTGGTDALFTGYASVFDAPYTITDFLGDFTETVNRSAFDKTISQGCDTAFLLNHQGMTLARTKSGTMKLATDSTGLHVQARLDPANYTVQAIRSAVERKDMDEMSFAFRTIDDSWSDDYAKRELLEVSLHHGDASVVNYGANGATAGLVSMRGRGLEAAARLIGPDAFSEMLQDYARSVRSGAAMSAANTATLKHCLSLFSAADRAVDEGQMVLSQLLSVPNPDEAQDAAMQQNAAQRIAEEALVRAKEGVAAAEERMRIIMLAESRDLGDVCNCCPDCQGLDCDGSCCDICTATGIGDADNTDSLSLNAATSADYERRIAIARLMGDVA